ncbi:SDR family NAD(P)-dependent oxidoreductase, partial [Falsiroseomonas oryzae]|uniref:SDR family NAD(P)-dependent oxidoreductase n=1 Tax=Falsiroseomonas oryzae TaxID=2766473 RepID=UPI0022EB6794
AVTGGAGGIGRALVGALLAQGCRVAVLDLPASIARHAPPDGVFALPLDATREQEVGAAFARLADAWGGLDGLVTLAGFAGPKQAVAETTSALWTEVTAGNLGATFQACRAALPLLRAGTAPSVVTMASGLAAKAAPGYGPYAAAKAGVLALTRVLAAENAPWLRVNAVAPSAVDTAFLRGGTGRGGDDGTAPPRLDREAYLRAVPLGRLATPEDVVGPILFLLSPAAAYVTGQVLHVNGGLLMP